MTRTVISEHFPYIPIRLQIGQQVAEVAFNALLDTGFDGHIIVPETHAPPDEAPEGRQRLTLADGSVIWRPYFFGELHVGQMEPLSVFVTVVGEESIMGLAVARNFRIVLDHGRRITVGP